MQVTRLGSLAGAAPRAANQTPAFAQTLSKAIDAVNQRELEAQEASRLLASGQITDLHAVTIAAQKAELALDLTIAVRNKVLEAYQEVMRMQI